MEIAVSAGYYSELVKDRDRIEREIGCEPNREQIFEWNSETKVNDIRLYWQVGFFERRDWPEQHEWLCNKPEAFQHVIRLRLVVSDPLLAI